MTILAEMGIHYRLSAFTALFLLSIQVSYCQLVEAHHKNDGFFFVGEELLDDSTLKIIGGEFATPGEFPYQVFIEKIWNSTKIYKCGGVILQNDIIATAAHCLFFREFGQVFAKPRKIWVTAGTHDLITKDPEIRKFEQISWASEIYPHPSFRFESVEMGVASSSSNSSTEQATPTSSWPIYDIALIRLHKRLNYTERVQPISLPSKEEGDDDVNYYQTNGTVTGYGRKEWSGRWTRRLRKVDVPLVGWTQCAKIFQGAANVTKDMICTGSKDGGLTPCNGDSGGPIACFASGDRNRSHPILCGLASFGASNCANFSVYTKVSSYLDWIRGIIG